MQAPTLAWLWQRLLRACRSGREQPTKLWADLEPELSEERQRQTAAAAAQVGERLRASSDVGECLAAISTLEWYDTPEAQEALCAAVSPERPQRIRLRALRALSAKQNPASLPTIRALVRDPDPSISLSALGALAQFGDRTVVPALCDALLDARTTVVGLSYRVLAAQALSRLAERCPGPELEEALVPLRMLARIWGKDQHVFQETLAAVERALYTDLPIPAAVPGPGEETLPRPANPPSADPEGLPMPSMLRRDPDSELEKEKENEKEPF
ncbi:MAG: HEAT repeat domain-containing protein [Armatimonadota bacterium]